MRRFGRTLVGYPTARRFAYDAHLIGADRADYSGSCQQPVIVPVTGVRSLALDRLEQWEQGTMDYAEGHGHIGGFSEPRLRHADVAVRCRRCPACLKARSYHWTERAAVECALSSRTWFGTLTLRPEMHFRCRAEAQKRIWARSSGYAVDSDDGFKEIVRPVTQEFQLFAKRVRKHARGLRYLLTVEKHKSGLPHLHLLLHERGEAVTHAVLSSSWNWGFSKFKLVSEDDQTKHARYVCKYLAKSMVSRIHASRNYGSPQKG